MRIERHADPVAFQRLVTPLLMRDECRYNLELAIVGRVAGGEQFGAEPPVLLSLHDGDELAGMAFMTPPWHLNVATVPVGAAAELAAYAVEHGIRPPGLVGTAEATERFATAYADLTGTPWRRQRSEGIYRLRTVVPPPAVPGSLREVTEDEFPLVMAWDRAFQADAGVEVRPDDEARMVRRARDHLIWFWDDGGPVSMVGCGGFTPNGARIGPVYTPREHRRRGYASAATAAASQRLLDRGLTFTFLYTDLANPTANRIYQAIGYERVGDAQEVAFGR